MRVLLLCHYNPYNAAMVTEHINAIIKYSVHDIFVYTDLVKNNGDLKLNVDLNCFDAIIIHYSIFIAIEQYISVKSRYQIAKFSGAKVVFLQDEYRFIDRSINAMHELGVDIVFTCVPEHSIQAVYPTQRMSGIRVINTLTGYPSDYLSTLNPIPLKKRCYDVSYRGRRYPDWHGRMGREKFEIGKQFQRHARKYRLRTNISSEENRRVYGSAWVHLIQNSRAVLGVESGASVFDFGGDIAARTETMRALLGKKKIKYDELRQRFFVEREDKIDLAQISPRLFEAICLRTMCILYEGNYSGILVPDTHYLSLKKDFSNIEHVCNRLCDDVFVAEITANAYADIAQGQTHTYRNFVRTLDQEIATIEKFRHGLHDKIIGAHSDRSQDQRETDALRETYDTSHPFNMVLYPHSLPYNLSNKFTRFMSSKIPWKLKSRIKFLIR